MEVEAFTELRVWTMVVVLVQVLHIMKVVISMAIKDHFLHTRPRGERQGLVNHILATNKVIMEVSLTPPVVWVIIHQ